MGLAGLFSRAPERLLAVDVGAHSVKLMELDVAGERPQLLSVAERTFASEVFSGNALSGRATVASTLQDVLTDLGQSTSMVATAVPGPSVFTKRTKLPRQPLKELHSTIQFEAGNVIPHNIDAVHLDYHILGLTGKDQVEVLVVAVKNEVIDGFVDTLADAGLTPAVVDVDVFALQNAYELLFPEDVEKTVALVNVGHRYSGVNICRNGMPLFTGDISSGGRAFTEGLAAALGIGLQEAEELKCKGVRGAANEEIAQAFGQQLDALAAEINRQLSFFWSASGAEGGIDKICLSGGGARVDGLPEVLQEKTGIECVRFDPFERCELGEEVDAQDVRTLGPSMAVAFGLAVRQVGDREVPELD